VTPWQKWLPDIGVGALVALLGLFEVFTADFPELLDQRSALVVVSLAIGTAVACARHAPAIGLGLVWLTCGLQVLTDSTILLTELAIAIVAFGTARWGRPATVWLSALSIPLAAVAAVVFVGKGGVIRVLELAGVTSFIQDAYKYGDTWQIGAAIVGLAVLGVPWLAGIALRFSSRATASRESQVTAEAERDQAEEIARLREEQTRLARDVHDVVGHSLAVILAQAESAQYLEEADTAALRTTMANIASSARTSLQDVRQVLTTTTDAAAPRSRSADLDSLVEGVRASGHEVVATEVGTPHPLPPELEMVAFRVLQEMLTNALKHGRRDQPVRVERHWEGELRIEVQNAIDPGSDETQPIATADPGQGIDGMRRRLESVGGRLDVRRRTDPATFTATAWVPLRALR
jgi:signal transduction histidine kinase